MEMGQLKPNLLLRGLGEMMMSGSARRQQLACWLVTGVFSVLSLAGAITWVVCLHHLRQVDNLGWVTGEQRMNKCKLCEYKRTTLKSLKHHMKSVHEKEFV